MEMVDITEMQLENTFLEYILGPELIPENSICPPQQLSKVASSTSTGTLPKVLLYY